MIRFLEWLLKYHYNPYTIDFLILILINKLNKIYWLHDIGKILHYNFKFIIEHLLGAGIFASG